MDISKLILLNSIKNYQNVSDEFLQKCVDNASIKTFEFIVNLFCESHLSINDYLSFKSYIIQIANQYFNLYNNYTINEQQWLIFLIIIKIYTIYNPTPELVIEDYEKLPVLVSNKKELNQAQTQIKAWILPYYLTCNKKF